MNETIYKIMMMNLGIAIILIIALVVICIKIINYFKNKDIEIDFKYKETVKNKEIEKKEPKL